VSELIRLGIDTGGSSLKAAVVAVDSGALLTEPRSFPTPSPSSPPAIATVLRQVVAAFPQAPGPIGFAFPAVVKAGVACTAANVDPAWIGTDGAALMQEAIGRAAVFINDADAAGLAEMRFGAGRNEGGTVMTLTFGTGIGSAIFHDGCLLPNTEFGHMEIRGMEAEHRASARVRTAELLGWEEWAGRVNEVLARLHALLWPDLFIIGGGVSENWARFGHLLESRARIVPAQLGNTAGLVGAALATTSKRGQ
jgi:polyphosphate glucokinase